MPLRPTVAAFLLAVTALAVTSPARVGKIILVAGGTEERVAIPAQQAKLREPFGVAFDRSGRPFIIEMALGNRLLRLDADDTLRHVAGPVFRGDGLDPAEKPSCRRWLADRVGTRSQAITMLAGDGPQPAQEPGTRQVG